MWFPRLAHARDVFWCVIVSVDQIAHSKHDCRTLILTMIFYRTLVSESSVTGLGVHTRRCMFGNITLHSLCYLARVRPVILPTNLLTWPLFYPLSQNLPRHCIHSLQSPSKGKQVFSVSLSFFKALKLHFHWGHKFDEMTPCDITHRIYHGSITHKFVNAHCSIVYR